MPRDNVAKRLVGEVDMSTQWHHRSRNREIRKNARAGFECNVQIDSFIISYGDGFLMRTIAIGNEVHSVGASLDGAVEVARWQMALHHGKRIVVPRNGDRGLYGLACRSISHCAVDAVKALVHKSEDGIFVDVPEVGQLVAVGQFGVRALNREFAALRIAVHIILATSANHVPLSAIGDAVVEVVHVIGVHFVGEVGVLVANELIPSIIRMECVGVVPRVVHHLGTAVIVGAHHKSVFFGKLHKPFCFSLVGIAIGVWTAIGVGIVAVHINTVGVVAGGPVHVVVACVISSVRVGIRANIEVDVLHNGLNFRLVRIFKQIVNQAKH